MIGIEENVTKIIKKKLKRIRDNKDKIDTNKLMEFISDELKDYNILTKTPTEIILKIDKKTNIKELENIVRKRIMSIIQDKEIDINLLFKFISINNQFIIRLKRKID